MPPKLLLARYGEPVLLRHPNRLPFDPWQNNGFGRHTLSTHNHNHNGHHGAENDGFTGAYFFPGQFYDDHWPIVHAGFTTINTSASDIRCGAPNGSDGTAKDWGNLDCDVNLVLADKAFSASACSTARSRACTKWA